MSEEKRIRAAFNAGVAEHIRHAATTWMMLESEGQRSLTHASIGARLNCTRSAVTKIMHPDNRGKTSLERFLTLITTYQINLDEVSAAYARGAAALIAALETTNGEPTKKHSKKWRLNEVTLIALYCWGNEPSKKRAWQLKNIQDRVALLKRRYRITEKHFINSESVDSEDDLTSLTEFWGERWCVMMDAIENIDWIKKSLFGERGDTPAGPLSIFGQDPGKPPRTDRI